jgi:type IV fimbrial biogenesis protein FimT
MRPRGFTLLELLMTITVAGVLLSIAVPSMASFLRSQRVVTAADSLNSAVAQARTIAAASNSYVSVAPIVTGDWQSGWRVFKEGGTPDGAYDASTDTLIVQYEQLQPDMNVTVATFPAGLGYVSFSPVGYSQSLPGKTQMSMTAGFQLGTNSRVVEVNLLGRARVCNPNLENQTCAMPAP